MTSGVALETSTAGPQHPEKISEKEGKTCYSSGLPSCEDHDDQGPDHRASSSKRRQISVPVSVTQRLKKSRIPVQRTHSPKDKLASPLRCANIQKITPTLEGIKEVARHLIRSRSRILAESDGCSFVALPTECTYEVCSLLQWSKRETLSEENVLFREDQLGRLKTASSSSCVHVYLQHHNIQQLDRLLEFPKKAFATKQKPDICCAFNESRLLFQKLADQFWPGPVHLYLPPQSFSPNGLLQTKFHNQKFLGFRCPSHPLTVKVLKQIREDMDEPVVLVGSPVHCGEARLLKAQDVCTKFLETSSSMSNSKILVLHGEERQEIFIVPTCNFGDEWLECWIVPEKRTIVLRGKSKRDVMPQLKEILRSPRKSNRIISSVLQHWKVADQRGR